LKFDGIFISPSPGNPTLDVYISVKPMSIAEDLNKEEEKSQKALAEALNKYNQKIT
jgi:hypothetical protein